MEFNPIQSVDGVELLHCPSKYQYNLQDVSAADSGRTEDTIMDKMRIGQKVKLELCWNFISIQKCSEILQMFNPEYITVTYLDAMTGGYETKEFYVGDRKAPAYNTRMGLWENVAFNIIER